MINKETLKDKNILLLDHIEEKIKSFVWEKLDPQTSYEKMKKADALVSYTVWYDYLKDEVIVTPINSCTTYIWEKYQVNKKDWFKQFYTMNRADFGKGILNSEFQVVLFTKLLKKLVTFYCPDKDILPEDVQEIIRYSLNWNRAKYLKAEEVPGVDENLSDYYPEVKNIFEQGGLQILSLSNVYGEKSRPIDSTLLLEYYLIKDVEPQSEIVTDMKKLILQQMQELLNTLLMDDKKLAAQLEAMFGLVEISNQFKLHPDIKRHLPIRIERKDDENSKE